MNLEAILPPGLTPEQVVIMMAALTAFVSFFAVWNALIYRDPAARRAEQMATQREALRAGIATTRRRRPERQQTLSLMSQVVDKLKLAQSMQADKITTNLARAGWRGKDAQVRYLFMKVALPFAFGGTAAFMLYGLNFGQLDSMGNLIGSLIAVILGAYAPDIIIKNAVTKRQNEIRKSMPDALDLMVICAEAGLSLDATLMRVADEMGSAGPEISDEFSLTSLELGFLPDRQKALENLANRSTVSTMRGMVNTLMQAERYGTPLAHSLRVLSQESRDERMLRAEEKAARLPALLTVPMIVFILPPLFIVIIGPAVISIMDNFVNR
jgi:tight adherence protein C